MCWRFVEVVGGVRLVIVVFSKGGVGLRVGRWT